MFAIIAAVIMFLLGFLHVHLGDVDLFQVALGFVFLHLAFAWSPWTRYRRQP